MDYISVSEASKRWGYSESTIRNWCKKGTVSVTCKAVKKSGRWQIPADAVCPKTIKKRK